MQYILGIRKNREQETRILLREIESEDAQYIVRWRAVPEVYQFFRSAHEITLQEHLKWYNTQYLNDNDRKDFIAEEKETGKPIGVFSIKKLNSYEGRCAEVSYLLQPEAQKKGYGGEAVLVLIWLAKEKWSVTKMIAEIHEDNSPSIAFAKRLGFVRREQSGSFVVYEKSV